MKNKKGISLIVLVITIIVMIILATSLVLTISNSGIISRANEAVQQTDLAQVKNLASVKWAEAYLNKDIKDIEKYVIDELAEEGITRKDYRIKVTQNGVDVGINWLSDEVDGVPIPKGFVASQVEGEKTKREGLVIYEGLDPVTMDNVEVAKRTRNQYVWIPVDNFSQFVRGIYDTNIDDIIFSNELGRDHWELVINESNNMPSYIQNENYVTKSTLAEAQEMYASIKEYGGFYIGRYEVGVDREITKENYRDENGNIILESRVYSVMGKLPYVAIPWTGTNTLAEDTNGAVQVARSVYPSNSANKTGVVSTLVYGVQWDRVLAWWKEAEVKDINGNKIRIEESIAYGNYKDYVVISADEFNDGSRYASYIDYDNIGSYQNITDDATKDSGAMWRLSTGALKAAKVTNIYDMAGNVWEWVMSGRDNEYRILRGGSCMNMGSDHDDMAPVKIHLYTEPASVSPLAGFRVSLYIKK